MKKLLLIVIYTFTICLANAKGKHSNSSGPANPTDLFTTNFISFTVPINYQGRIAYLNSNDVIEEKDVNGVKHDATILLSFPNLVSAVTLYKSDDEGNLSITGNTLSAKNSTYVVIYDFAQTQTIKVKDNDGNVAYYILVGVSVRMAARVKTKTRGINLASPVSLGIAASRNKVSGSLEVRANGISSQQINTLVPVTTDLSESSIANALQTVATVKTHIYDSATKITPQFLAFSAVGSGNKGVNFSVNDLTNKVKTLMTQ